MNWNQPVPQTRRLLARVRDVMAGAETPQVRLDKITSIIAADMVAEVCSVYIRRAGDVLELFATQGLKPDAVRNTRLHFGEGLVGDIAARARPMALADAQSHSAFMFLPDTGEEIYKSLMGVPILRSGRVMGVVVVQNRTERDYSEEEVETLQTVAMVMAEMVAGGELIPQEEMIPADGIALKPLRLDGSRLNGGIGIGTAVLHEPRFQLNRLVAENPEQEQSRLKNAVADMHGAIDTLLESSDLKSGGEHRDILETYRMIAEDAGWIARIEEGISGGLTAEAAVQKVQNGIRARMRSVTDPYLRERIHDFDDLAHRLLQHLLGEDDSGHTRIHPDDMIVIARTMGPAQLLDYDRERMRGLILEEGSANAHVAIVARALDIPVVGQTHEILSRIEEGDVVVVDGDNAQVYIRPGEDIVHAYAENLAARKEQKQAYVALRNQPAETLDGHRVNLAINAGMLVDLNHLDEFGADGVGLYRTEVPFMIRNDFPDVATQQQIYAKIFEHAGGRPVSFRTLDVGGDKVLPYWEGADEENPAMGWRAIRISLDRPAILRHQLRALLQAAEGRNLRVMFPMIADLSEFEAAKALLDKELQRARDRGETLPSEIKVGAMLEVPSLIFQLPALLKEVDFLSVGSNDLLQFLYASDRGNPLLSDRYDLLSPTVLNLLKSIVEQCDEAGVEVSLCGEMAGTALGAMALIGIGFRSLSVAPPAIGPVKMMVRSLSVDSLVAFMEAQLENSQTSIRMSLQAFARDRGVQI